ncbi:hypothetical protein BGX26_009155 [Mortierella sp. AD094]|nr:hypothetical protein BGX26_009155 [Mortierella sp. AD094]
MYSDGYNDFIFFSPLHGFMLDLDDPHVKKMFSQDDWAEIIADLPSQEFYTDSVGLYLDSFSKIRTIEELEESLRIRPASEDCLLPPKIKEPSPFAIVNTLGESWWIDNAWGVCLRLTNGVPNAFMLPGEKTGHDSAEQKSEFDTKGSPSFRI